MSSNHVKFDDSEDVAVATKALDVGDIDGKSVATKEVIADLNDSESDDEAPEEEGASTTKNEIEEKLKQNEEAKKHEQQLLREKRRKQNALFKEQQSLKKRKNDFEEDKDNSGDEPLEELPEEFLQRVEESESSKSTHINFHDEIEDEEELQTIQREMTKKKKKNQLKNLRRETIKHGPVNVTLLAPSSQSRSMAPKKETKIINTKDKWLRRKALNKK